MARIFRERFKTKNDVFDSFTERTLFELGCRFSFESEQLSPVSIGKEANVFSVKAKPMKLAVKVYRLEVCDFNRM
ncbi:serine protein kinase RIO, partial [Candidatus Woesearchaeota archaeon CG10_big_fil_rev_8_21_14_0_10_47_5]